MGQEEFDGFLEGSSANLASELRAAETQDVEMSDSFSSAGTDSRFQAHEKQIKQIQFDHHQLYLLAHETAKSIRRVIDEQECMKAQHRDLAEQITGLNSQIQTLSQAPSAQQLHALMNQCNNITEQLKNLKQQVPRHPEGVPIRELVDRVKALDDRISPYQDHMDDKYSDLDRQQNKLFIQFGELKNEVKQRASISVKALEALELELGCRQSPIFPIRHDTQNEDLSRLSTSYHGFVETTNQTNEKQNSRLNMLREKFLEYSKEMDGLTIRVSKLEDLVRQAQADIAAAKSDVRYTSQNSSTPNAEVQELKSLVKSQGQQISILTRQLSQDRKETQSRLERIEQTLSGLHIAGKDGDQEL
ncbi:MAG: hypothetical protein L6R38_001024 [Xanthoria sp. 2 TBL-2021]|nr:MAG: hypothetical protein L6R38_001024 [Xanthoria sp. 2 TBL-2021]